MFQLFASIENEPTQVQESGKSIKPTCPKLTGEQLAAKPIRSLNKLCANMHFIDLLKVSRINTKCFQAVVQELLARSKTDYFRVFSPRCMPTGTDYSFITKQLQVFTPLSVRLSYDEMDEETLGLIAEYCPDLEAIEITGPIVMPKELAVAHEIFPKLKKIIVWTSEGVWNESANIDWLVEELHISGTHEWQMPSIKVPSITMPRITMPSITMPKLNRLKLQVFTESGLADSPLLGFLAKNTQIEHLELVMCTISFNRLRSLASNLPNLKSLTIEYLTVASDDYQSDFTFFASLKTVKIGKCSNINAVLELFIGAPIEHLELSTINKDSLEPIRRLVRLTKVTLHGLQAFKDVNVIDLMHTVDDLRTLHLDEAASEIVTLDYIKRMVKGMPPNTELNIEWNARRMFARRNELKDISALLAESPEFRLNVRIAEESIMVSGDFESKLYKFLSVRTSHSNSIFSFICLFNRFRKMNGDNIPIG